MKIREDENVLELAEPIDATARPILALYTNGDPEKNPDSYAITLVQVAQGEILEMSRKAQEQRGRPYMFAVLHETDKQRLALWPRPDREYYAVFEFNPPRRRL